jgi:serine/threonine-protein kinase RsbW
VKAKRFYVCKIHASLENVKGTVNNILDYFGREFGHIDESNYFEFKVILNELLINAIKHGSKENEEKFVRVVAGLAKDDYALLAVEDDGDGYDPESFERNNQFSGASLNNSEEKLAIVESGRGIFIVKNLCDEFLINKKGNKVVVNKKLIRA